MELLIAIVDRGPAIDDIKAGEVITIQPDGWGWSQAELTNPNWRIVRSSILQTHADSLLAPNVFSDLQVPGTKYPRKLNILTVSSLPALSSGTITAVPSAQVVLATAAVAQSIG